jgi:TRAP-type C4-dicarboxylate transport system substrate-binding protein
LTGHNITIGKRSWSRLTPAQQKIFTDTARETHREYLTWVGDFESKSVASIKAAGGTFTPFSADEMKKWKAAAPDFLGEWEKATAKATGDAETPKKVAARWRQLLAQ